MNRLRGAALAAGLLAGVTACAGSAQPAAARPANADAMVGSGAERPGGAIAGSQLQVRAPAPTILIPMGAHPAGPATQAATAPNLGSSAQLVTLDTSSPTHLCAAALHGIVGPECPSK